MKSLNDILSHSVTKNDYKKDENSYNSKSNKIRALSPDCAQQLESITNVKIKELNLDKIENKKKINHVDVYYNSYRFVNSN